MDVNLLLKAVDFAADKHKYQRRKGFNQVPYINHPLRVAKLLSDCGEVDEMLIIASVLHDVVEDTDASEEQIEEEFGKGVKDLVMEVSDNKELPFAVRKELQIKAAPGLSSEAKKLKIADKICNIIDLLSYPVDWSTERKMSYLDWSKEVVKGCRHVNEELESRFDKILEDGYHKLEKEF